MALKRRLGPIAGLAGVVLMLALVAFTVVDVATTTNAETARGEAVVTMRGQSFVPRVLAIAPGHEVTIRISNDSWLHHTFTVPAAGIDVELGPGQDATIHLTLPRGSSFQFFCRFHHASGMHGLLVGAPTTRPTGGPQSR